MYIFVREDLSHPQQIVQASHAASEASFRFEKPEQPLHIVLCGVKDQHHLMNVAQYLGRHGIEFELFFEPDYDTGNTAIATQPLYDQQRKPLRKFKLLQEKENEETIS